MDDRVVQRGTVEESAPKKYEPQARTAVRKKSRRVGLIAFLIILLIALGTMVVYGLMKRSAWTAALQLQTNQNIAGLTVAVVRPEKAPAKIVVDLPGQTEAYTQAPIYAQTSGYLKKWFFDIGSHVRAGDVLGEIDTPAVDEQFNQRRHLDKPTPPWTFQMPPTSAIWTCFAERCSRSRISMLPKAICERSRQL